MAMYMVIDTNQINTKYTRYYLNSHPDTNIILPNEVHLEALKSGTVHDFISQFDSLFELNKKVFLSRPIGDILSLDGNDKKVATKIVDWEGTDRFRVAVKEMRRRSNSDKYVHTMIEESQKAAKSAFDRLSGAGDMSGFIKDAKSYFTETEIKKIRLGGPVDSVISQKMYDLAGDYAADIYAGLIKKPNEPVSFIAKIDSPLYRLGLVIANYIIHLIGMGSTNRARNKTKNDNIDNIVNMIGTYFNGVLTEDRMPLQLHYIVRRALKKSGGEVPDFALDFMYDKDQ